MGNNCNMKRNPCVEISDRLQMAGNVACNVGQGGKCIPTMETNIYHCDCPVHLTSDPALPFPNCLGFKDQCSSRICIRGDCISSRDGQETYCACPMEAYGESCALTRGKWAHWSPWSECTPNCGIDHIQRRVRTRGCLGEACQGGGGHIQIELCNMMPCPDEILALSRQGRPEELGELKLQMLQAQAARYFKLLGAVAECLLLITCIFSAAVVTAMTLNIHCL